jgi:hypothetical protein
MSVRRGAAAAALALALGLSGCGGGETTVETDDGTVTVEQDGSKVEIESEDGTTTVTGESDGELPDGWPAEIVLPDGGEIQNAVGVSGQDSGWTVASNYPDTSPEDLTDQLTQSLESAGFESKGSFTSQEGSVSSFEGDDYAVSVIVGPEGSGSSLVITVAQK